MYFFTDKKHSYGGYGGGYGYNKPSYGSHGGYDKYKPKYDDYKPDYKPKYEKKHMDDHEHVSLRSDVEPVRV